MNSLTAFVTVTDTSIWWWCLNRLSGIRTEVNSGLFRSKSGKKMTAFKSEQDSVFCFTYLYTEIQVLVYTFVS